MDLGLCDKTNVIYVIKLYINFLWQQSVTYDLRLKSTEKNYTGLKSKIPTAEIDQGAKFDQNWKWRQPTIIN